MKKRDTKNKIRVHKLSSTQAGKTSAGDFPLLLTTPDKRRPSSHFSPGDTPFQAADSQGGTAATWSGYGALTVDERQFLDAKWSRQIPVEDRDW